MIKILLFWMVVQPASCLLNQEGTYNQEQKLLRHATYIHKWPPPPEFNVVRMIGKRKSPPFLSTLLTGGMGEAGKLQDCKKLKSLMIFARDCRPPYLSMHAGQGNEYAAFLCAFGGIICFLQTRTSTCNHDLLLLDVFRILENKEVGKSYHWVLGVVQLAQYFMK